MKADARDILDRAEADARGWVPDYAKGAADLWTPKLIKMASLDAFRMLNRVVGRVTPRGNAAYWPEFQNNPADWPDSEKQERAAERRSKYRTRITIARMEAVFGLRNPPEPTDNWFAGPMLLVPDYRAALLQWIDSELRGESFTDTCLRRRWVYTTACSRRDKGASILAQRLNREGVATW